MGATASAGRVLCTHLTLHITGPSAATHSRHFVHSGQKGRERGHVCPWPPHSKKSTLSLKERVLPESMGDLSLANPLATPQLDTGLCSQVREPDSRPERLSNPRDSVWSALTPAAAGPLHQVSLCPACSQPHSEAFLELTGD